MLPVPVKGNIVPLSAGTHTVTVSVDVKGVQFYGFRVCTGFREYASAGEAAFTLRCSS